MNLDTIKNSVTRAVAPVCLQLKDKSPSILIGVGIVGVVSSAVLACRSTLKAEKEITNAKERLNYIRDEKQSLIDGKESVFEDLDEYKKELTHQYISIGWTLTKLYLPSVILGTFSIGCVFASNRIMKERCATLGAAYTSVKSAYDKYRQNVIDELGEDADNRFLYGMKKQEIEETVVDEKTGKEKKVKKKVEMPTDLSADPFARYYEPGCNNFFEMDPRGNLASLDLMEQMLNYELIAKGHLFANDIYKYLNMELCPQGQLEGFIDNPNLPEGLRQQQIKLGHRNEAINHQFLAGRVDTCIIRPNIQGNIMEAISHNTDKCGGYLGAWYSK